MAKGKRSSAARRGKGVKQRITTKQKAARRKNIAIARKSKKKVSRASIKRKGGAKRLKEGTFSAKSRGYDKRISVKTKTQKRIYKKAFKKIYENKRIKGTKKQKVARAHASALKASTSKATFYAQFGATTSVRFRIPSGQYKPRRRRK